VAHVIWRRVAAHARAAESGYLADLLPVDGDPLADIGVLQDRTRLAFIMKDGVRYLPCEGAPHVRRLH